MKTRKKPLGSANMVGANIERIRKMQKFKQVEIIAKMQSMGVDINVTSYSKLEGQIRLATDIEVYTIAKILQVDISELFE
ncbi:MAG: XRE family transcriptional regulator [Clostridia bacterium]|nr:XRE family transcriptional regulator [Clostridia bacterium]MDY6184654.1 XRE family transcriptional regulator [Eubacteriales bacterium]